MSRSLSTPFRKKPAGIFSGRPGGRQTPGMDQGRARQNRPGSSGDRRNRRVSGSTGSEEERADQQQDQQEGPQAAPAASRSIRPGADKQPAAEQGNQQRIQAKAAAVPTAAEGIHHHFGILLSLGSGYGNIIANPGRSARGRGSIVAGAVSIVGFLLIFFQNPLDFIAFMRYTLTRQSKNGRTGWFAWRRDEGLW